MTSGYRVDAKIVLLGSAACGKTSLVERYLHNRFAADDGLTYQATIGAAYGARRVEAFGGHVVLGIWDTAGSERYQSMSRIYYRDAWAALLCYDMTDSKSFDKVEYWAKELQAYEPKARLYFIGTKRDLIDTSGRLMSHAVVCHIAQGYMNDDQLATCTNGSVSGSVFETSARNAYNVRELFERLAKDYVISRRDSPTKSPSSLDGGKSTFSLDPRQLPRNICNSC